jgi:cyclophilin family peptidyl-prolyl cis-trans isomerase
MRRVAPVLVCALLLPPAIALAANPVVRVATPLGSFDIELCSESSEVCEAAVPDSVDNFLGYVDRGDYEGSILHRSTTLLSTGVVVIQGGGFRREGPEIIREVPAQLPIRNEFNQSNRRGTVAYARTSVVDSATSHWFVNVSNSNSILDSSNEGFTVFGVVTGDGMQVVDEISRLPLLEFFDPTTSTAPAFLFDLFDPTEIITAFESVPFRQDFVDRVLDPELPPPPLVDVADAFLSTDITRVPEPAAGLAGATALTAVALLARRRPAASV